MEWVYRIIVLLGIGVGGFFVGKYFYDNPAIPPEPVALADTVTVYDTKVDTVYEDHYTVLRDTTILVDTVYVDVKMAEDVYETTFEFQAIEFRVSIMLITDRPIQPFVMKDPIFSYRFTDAHNKKLVKAYDGGYSIGYNNGYDVGKEKNDTKNTIIFGGVGLLIGVVVGGFAL